MNDETAAGREAFDEAFSTLGRRASGDRWETFLSVPRKAIGLLSQDFYILRKVYVDFVENDTINAAATFHHDWCLVACNTGAAEVFTTLYSFILSQPDCLPGIGDETREQRWIDSLSKCEWWKGRKSIEQQLTVCRAVPNCMPIDETRRWWAAFLSYISLEFLYFHELGHLVLEHLPMDGRVTLEFGGTTINQFHELEADGWAMQRLFFALVGRVGAERNLPTHESAVAALTIALFFVYLVLDNNRSAVGDYRTNHHPHPAVRMAILPAILDFTTDDKETQAMISDAFASSYMVALQSAEALRMQGASLSMLKDGEEIGKEYLRIVDAGHEQARKQDEVM